MEHRLITATHFRAAKLASVALPSIAQQTDQRFTWILVNDGLDLATRELANNISCSIERSFAFIYVEMPHPSPQEGFGLCHARNLGLSIANAHAVDANQVVVSYLDDDNKLTADFVACTKQFFQQDSPTIQYGMVQQFRQREVVEQGVVVRRGNPFVSPGAEAGLEALIKQQALFDSNGFSHRLGDAPNWNPQYRIFADYEYLLQCVERWGSRGFGLNQRVLVHYTQSSEGIIGRSSYQEWIQELESMLKGDYSALSPDDRKELVRLTQHWQAKVLQNQSIPAFAKPKESSDGTTNVRSL